MPDWFVYVIVVVQFAVGAYCGYMIGHKRGRALCPTDYDLRDVVRQRDQLMRERDEARQLAQWYFGALQHVTRADAEGLH